MSDWDHILVAYRHIKSIIYTISNLISEWICWRLVIEAWRHLFWFDAFGGRWMLGNATPNRERKYMLELPSARVGVEIVIVSKNIILLAFAATANSASFIFLLSQIIYLMFFPYAPRWWLHNFKLGAKFVGKLNSLSLSVHLRLSSFVIAFLQFFLQHSLCFFLCGWGFEKWLPTDMLILTKQDKKYAKQNNKKYQIKNKKEIKISYLML